MATDPNAAAAELLKNNQFLQLFQRALGGGGDGGEAAAAGFLKGMPEEGDPKREAWLCNLQQRLHEETLKDTKKDLEQVHSDENGQWMYILPEPGFCVKCNVSGGAKVFINICEHERIGEPVPMNNPDAGDEMRYRIPLSCGQARPDTDRKGTPCKVYDVIVNPATIKRCANDSEFRRFVAALSMQWIKQKSEPTLNADEFRNLNFKAKGQLEPQRIRLSTAPMPTNAMKDEIRLPSSGKAATLPTHLAGSQGTGKLIQEMNSAGPSTNTTAAVVAAAALPLAAGREERIVIAGSENAPKEAEALATKAPQVVEVRKEGVYDWSTHRKPFLNVFFRDAVPALYYVEMFIPNIQTIREVEVCVGVKKVECFYVDDEDCEHEPFLGVVFDYPISEEIMEAKFVKKTSLLKMKFAVRLPDETNEATRTVADRDAVEIEEEEEKRILAQREAKFVEEQARLAKQQEAEEQVMAARKSYVENLSALQSGDLPPALKEEIDAMPKEQLPSMLARIEGRIRKGDSIDDLFEKLPDQVVNALGDYIREKLSLEPRVSSKEKRSVKFSQDTQQRAAPSKDPSEEAGVPTRTEKLDVPTDDGGSDDSRVVFNYAAKAEKLFGVAFHNRYLFALDNC